VTAHRFKVFRPCGVFASAGKVKTRATWRLWIIIELMKPKKIDPVHPGEILLHDFMEPLELSQSALAKALGVTSLRVSQIVRGQRAITADTALRLSRYFGTRPGWWMDLRTHYDLETAADKLEAHIARAVKPRALHPRPEPVPA
jgi:addiction module HigA family antidote